MYRLNTIGRFLTVSTLIASLFVNISVAAENEVSVKQIVSYESIKSEFASTQPDIPVTSINKSPIPGLYELVSEGRIFYITEHADYIIDGNVFDAATLNNLTSKAETNIHLATIDEIEDDEMIIYQPDSPRIGSLTVFTDTTCPYCQKIHAELDDLLSAGIEVKYLLYPRAGAESEAYLELQSIWCSDNQQSSLTQVKLGESIPSATCDNPISKHIDIGNKVGLVGTPLMYLDIGEKVAGYQSAKEIINRFQAAINP